VTAGRAAPHAEVTLLDGVQEIGRARADARGEWVILPTEPLTPGARQLALRARRPGEDPVPARDMLAIVVPDPAGATLPAIPAPRAPPASAPPLLFAVPPLTVLLPAPHVPRPDADDLPLLPQGPLMEEASGPGPRRRLDLDLVDYQGDADIRFAGSAPAGAPLRLYADGTHLGDARADQAGHWELTPVTQPAFGRHGLRIDQLSETGRVVDRVEIPFWRERPSQDGSEGVARLVVQPGQTLWRIARQVYGRGTRYTDIYVANRSQISDPRRIYPGQVFALPGIELPGSAGLP
jgi:nucleoid-associated protein YgaU